VRCLCLQLTPISTFARGRAPWTESAAESQYKSGIQGIAPASPDTHRIAIEENKDYDIKDDTQLPFKTGRRLGQEFNSYVEEVQDIETGKVFARKSIITRKWNRVQGEGLFSNEVNIIRRLKGHHHIVQLFATYTTKHTRCMLLQSVADKGDLRCFLETFPEMFPSQSTQPAAYVANPIIESAFGCLAGGLAYIHARKIRHRDIKPQNILVHGDSVLYADFGLSLDTIPSNPDTIPLTPMYAAPEVLARTAPFSLSSDIFSLGCVFIEMFEALDPRGRQRKDGRFSEIMDHIHQELEAADIHVKLPFIPRLIIGMTAHKKDDRPTASEVYERLSRHPGFCCSKCKEKMLTPSSTVTGKKAYEWG
jgi:serine/threonine protein kinase